MLHQVTQELSKLRNPKKAKDLSWFFKTGKGEYGEGDVFWGVTVPLQRKVAKKFHKQASFRDIQRLLESGIHEHRFTALEMLVMKYDQGSKVKSRESQERKIFDLYLKNTKHINNWDLVDTSAPYIVGAYLLHHDRKILYRLVRSKRLWERRIAIVATFAFIQKNQFSDTLKISELLLKDSHDLIHKAVGWMLREVGKKNQRVLERFLTKNFSCMSRTTLRYAIERFSETKRKKFLSSKTILQSKQLIC